MIKYILFFTLLFLSLLASANNGRDTLKYYLDDIGNFLNNGQEASAVRFVFKENPREKYFSVMDYYISGKLKLVGQSKREDGFGWVGKYLEYRENGKRRIYREYDSRGFVINYITYHQNGQIAATGHREEGTVRDIIDEYRDTLGNVTVTKGNGMQFIKNGVEEEYGPIVKGVKHGSWQRSKGKVVLALLDYDNGRFISGLGYDSLGKSYPFEVIYEGAKYKENIILMYARLRGSIKVARDVKKQLLDERFSVVFWVDEDGKITQPVLSRTFGNFIDDQVKEQILKMNGKWQGAREYGVPRKTKSVLTFTMADFL